MAHVRIEMDRGCGWEVRQEGEMDLAPFGGVDGITAQLPGYAIQYKHRAFVDGVMVGEAMSAKRRRRAVSR